MRRAASFALGVVAFGGLAVCAVSLVAGLVVIGVTIRLQDALES